MLPVVPIGGKTAVEPIAANVADGSYPITRVLNMYVNKAPGKPLDPNILGFIRFALSPEGQRLVAASGFVPLSEDTASLNLRRIETVR
jgi:phosphate transport system substrate-binding protein